MAKFEHQQFEEWLLSTEPITSEQSLALNEHILSCEHCHKLSIGWQEVEHILKAAPVVSPALGFTKRWQTRLAEERLRRGNRQAKYFLAFSLGGATLLLGVLAFLVWPVLQSPYPILLALAVRLTSAYAMADQITSILDPACHCIEGYPTDLMDWVGGGNVLVMHRLDFCLPQACFATEECVMKKIQFAILLVLLVALFLPTTALAKGLPEDKIVFGGTYTLESGEVLDGNLIIFGGSVTLEPTSVVNGEVIIFGGSLDAQGEITGNIVAIGGLVQLGDTAQVDQNVVTLGANLDRSQSAIVEGEVSSGFTGPFLFDFPGVRSVPDIQVRVNPFINLIWIFLRTLLWGVLLAVILVLLLPRALDTIGQAAVQQPLISGGLGLLTAILAPLLLFILVITICLSPLALIGVLVLVVAWGMGLIALGLEIGKRLADRMKQDWAPALSAGLGTLLLIFVLEGLREIVPCIGWLFPAIAGMVGLGAVVLTRFGTQGYPLVPPPATAGEPAQSMLMEAPPPSEVSSSLPPRNRRR